MPSVTSGLFAQGGRASMNKTQLVSLQNCVHTEGILS